MEVKEEANSTKATSFSLNPNDAVPEQKEIETGELLEQVCDEVTWLRNNFSAYDEVQTLAGRNSRRGNSKLKAKKKTYR